MDVIIKPLLNNLLNDIDESKTRNMKKEINRCEWARNNTSDIYERIIGYRS